MAVQLSARGQQDVYVTGKPSMTYFSTVFKKSTPFVSESVEYFFDSLASQSQTTRCTLPPRGDIISDITLKITFPQLVTIPQNVYCYPIWPTSIPPLQVYVMTATTAKLAFQAGQFPYYYSTYNVSFWVTPYLPDLLVTYNQETSYFQFTTTNPLYLAIGFTSEQSASFWGFDIVNPTYASTSFPGYTMYTIQNGSLQSQLNIIQSGWTVGYSPQNSSYGFSYNDSYATSIISEARLLVGGQIVSRVTGDYIKLLYDHDVPYENQSGLTALIGKGDTTSIKYNTTTSYVKLPFGIDNLPMCSLERNDVKVEVSFSNIAPLVNNLSTGSGSILDSASYEGADFRTIFNCSFYEIKSAPFLFNNFIVWTDRRNSGTYCVRYDITKDIADPTAYSSTVEGTIPENSTVFPTLNNAVVNGTRYTATNNGVSLYLQYQPVNDYINNINTIVTGTQPLWIYPTGGLGYTTTLCADSRYVYTFVNFNGFYLPINGLWAGVPYLYYDGSPNQVFTAVFYGHAATDISPTSGPGLEFLRRAMTNVLTQAGISNHVGQYPIVVSKTTTAPFTVSSAPTTINIQVTSTTSVVIGQYALFNQYPGIYGTYVTAIPNSTTVTIYVTGITSTQTITSGAAIDFRSPPTAVLNSQTTDGSNCTTSWTLTYFFPFGNDAGRSANFNNYVYVRYDTTLSINSPTAYSWYFDFNTLNQNLCMDYEFPVSSFSDGQYISASMQGDQDSYFFKIDTLSFLSASGYTTSKGMRTVIDTVTGIYPYINAGPWFTDGTWIYMGFFANTNQSLQRLLIGSDPNQNSSWNVVNIVNIIPDLVYGGWGQNVTFTQPAAYDGRYVYFCSQGGSLVGPLYFTYDTTQSFYSPSAYTWFSKHWPYLYDPVINPGFVMASQGPSPTALMNGAAFDSVGNLYVVMKLPITTAYTIYNPGLVPAVTINNQNAGYFVIKYSSTGYYIWSFWMSQGSYVGGANSLDMGLKVDSSDNLYVFASPLTECKDTQGTHVTFFNNVSYGGGYQGVIAKFSSAGVFQWRTLTINPPSYSDYQGNSITDISFDSSGNLYVTGQLIKFQDRTISTVSFVNAGAVTGSMTLGFTSKATAFSAQLNSSGAFQYVTFTDIANNDEDFDGAFRIQYDSYTSSVYTVGYYSNPYSNSNFSWRKTTGANYTWYSLAYSSSLNKFVAFGNGICYWSYGSSTTNINSWSTGSGSFPSSTTGVYGTWYSAASLFVAVAYGSATGAYSTDGQNWTSFTMPVSANFSSIASNASGIVAIINGSSTVYYSTSTSMPFTWNTATLPAATGWASVTASSSNFVVVSSTSALAVAYSTTATGSSWSTGFLPSALALNSVTWSTPFNCFVAVGNGATGVYSSTTNGSGTWLTFTLPVNQTWTSVASEDTNQVLIAIGASNSGAISYTLSGTWSLSVLPFNSVPWASIKWSPASTTFVAISRGTSGYAAGNFLTNGYNWSGSSLPSISTVTGPTLSGTTTNNGFLMKMNTSGTVSTSINIPPTADSSYYMPSGLFTDSSGNIYIASCSKTTLIGASTQVYLSKYNTSLTLQWTSVINGTYGNSGTPFMVQDSYGNIIITFAFLSPTITVQDSSGNIVKRYTKEPPIYVYDSFKDSLILKFNQDGFFVWGVQVTGAIDDYPIGLTADKFGNILWSGLYGSADFQVINSDGSVGFTNGFGYGTSVGENTGAGYIINVKINSAGFVQWGNTGNILGDSNFITSSGGTISGLYFAFAGMPYLLVQGPRYYYFYSFNYFGDLNHPTLFRFDPIGAPPNIVPTVTSSSGGFNASVIVQYDHLGPSEIQYFRKSLQTIVFENMQSLFIPLSPGTTTVTLPFLTPVKELYFLSNTFSNITSLGLTFNGEELFNFSGTYFNTIMPYESSVVMPSYNTYMYNFGSPVNMSRIASKILTVTQPNTTGLWVYAKCLNVFGVKDGVAGLLFNSQQYLV